MAITRTQTQVGWDSGGTSKTVSSAVEVESDQFTIDDTTVLLSIQLSADNAGSPASGDTAVFRIRWSNGDILGDTGNDFDTAEHAQYLALLDTYATNTPGEDPARKTIEITPVAKHFKIGCICANAATRNVVVRARVDEQRYA
jgi:hypothetical protein